MPRSVDISQDTCLGTRVSVSFGTHHGSFISGHLSWDTCLCQLRDTPRFAYLGTPTLGHISLSVSGHIVGHLSLSVSGHLSRFLHLVTLMLMLGHASQSYIPGQISRLTYIGTCIMRHVSWDTYLRTRILDTYLRSFISRGIRYGIHYSAHSSRHLSHISQDKYIGSFISEHVSCGTYLGTRISGHVSSDTYLRSRIFGYVSPLIYFARHPLWDTLFGSLISASQSYILGQIYRLIYLGTCIMRHVSWDTYLGTRIFGHVSPLIYFARHPLWDTLFGSVVSGHFLGTRVSGHVSGHVSWDTCSASSILGHVSGSLITGHVSRLDLLGTYFCGNVSRDMYLE